MTAADPFDEAVSAPGSRAPQPRTRESWPGRRPLVWAPRARTVELVLPLSPEPEQRRPMRLVGAHEPGYWRADERLAPGTDYQFSVDGGPAQPDPCSTLLPRGIHGTSRVLDEDFTWHDDAWRGVDLTRGTLLHLDLATVTAAGTLDAAALLLPAVAALGVDGVELQPVSAFDPAAGPEAGVRLFAVHDAYGGPRALQRFVDAAHRAGLAVVLDLPHRWCVADGLGLHAFGPYATGSRIGPRAGSPLGSSTPRINLDGSGSRGPRDFLVADALRWLTTFHVDALLLDTEILVDRSPLPFLGELAEAVQTVGAETGRPRTLLTDGPGRSNRLTTVVRHLLSSDHQSTPVEALRRLSESVFPAGVPAALHRVRRANARTSSILVDDLTRLPDAARTVPWAAPEPDEYSTPWRSATDLADHATLLAFAALAGTPLILDTEHVPVQRTGSDAARLVTWTRRLLTLRPSSLADLADPVDLRTAPGTVIARRGDSALVLVTARHPVEVDLADHLPTPAGAWGVAASWDEEATHLVAGRLRAPGRSVVILRRDTVALPGNDPRT